MPAEGDPHACTWMAWPSSGYTLGDTPAEADEARSTWAEVAHAVAEFEPVRMVVDPSAAAVARRRLGAHIEILEAPLDDAWMRDIGPTFVLGDGSDAGRLGAVDWVFNGWGQQGWAAWGHDSSIAGTVAAWTGAQIVSSPMVNEGGGIHVDGRGTVLVTETVQRDPRRNPGWSRSDVEAELARTIGAVQVVWLPRGLTRDYDDFGTRGHVDIVATISAPGVILLHSQDDPAHPDHPVTQEIRAALEHALDGDDPTWTILPVPAPQRLTDDGGPVDHSYLNHLVVNDGLIACTFDDPHDERALELLGSAYPGRRIVGVDARPLFARGGGIHCITQQQPAVG